ncbi:sigma-70 family RNA polymerase sigma factor [Nocardioides panacisoli]|uniref:sigma-70 family RNA polymerase sigma factor n=1 Tax=Nocardioides panacisoli TaxID=627624 RepID=UPI001C625CA8|nr:sigma-70 family RNA polymerase sigma factor [Nocardioides panacisoli]QYJ04029.1 sigma-70 family RNA polymerase sigma factor [Nocardioides panacisoli]
MDERGGGSGEPARSVAGLGDEDQVHEAYLRYGAEVYRFVLRGLGDPGAAQDVTQETFLKAWRHAHRYDPQLATLRVWLFGIARNTMIDHARAAGVRPWQQHLVDPTTAQAIGGAAADSTDRLLEAWLVEEALRRIADHHREAIVQTHLRERPYAEVAAELGIPVGTLRSRVFYGLRALREAMDEMGVSP